MVIKFILIGCLIIIGKKNLFVDNRLYNLKFFMKSFLIFLNNLKYIYFSLILYYNVDFF